MEGLSKRGASEEQLLRHKRLKLILYMGLFLGYAVFYYNRKSYSSLIPVLLQSKFLGASELGFITSCFAFSYGLSKFGSGVLSDKLPPKALFVAALIATGICNILFAFTDGVIFLSCVWFVNGLVQGFAWPQCAKLLKVWFKADEVINVIQLTYPRLRMSLTTRCCTLGYIYKQKTHLQWGTIFLFISACMVQSWCFSRVKYVCQENQTMQFSWSNLNLQPHCNALYIAVT